MSISGFTTNFFKKHELISCGGQNKKDHPCDLLLFGSHDLSHKSGILLEFQTLSLSQLKIDKHL